jgi:hypothetical protein
MRTVALGAACAKWRQEFSGATESPRSPRIIKGHSRLRRSGLKGIDQIEFMLEIGLSRDRPVRLRLDAAFPAQGEIFPRTAPKRDSIYPAAFIASQKSPLQDNKNAMRDASIALGRDE